MWTDYLLKYNPVPQLQISNYCSFNECCCLSLTDTFKNVLDTLWIFQTCIFPPEASGFLSVRKWALPQRTLKERNVFFHAGAPRHRRYTFWLQRLTHEVLVYLPVMSPFLILTKWILCLTVTKRPRRFPKLNQPNKDHCDARGKVFDGGDFWRHMPRCRYVSSWDENRLAFQK